MVLSRKHMEASNTFFLVYIEVVILLSLFNFQGLNWCGLTSPVVRGNDTDQEALLQFKAKITGCKHRRVTKLELQFLKLSGSLSPYIGNLSFLKELNLEENSFYNEIPQEFGHLKRVETLDLANNSISGEIPSNLSACSKLAVLDLRGNQLTGEIPASLGLLSNLKYLSLHNNSLRGSIPPSLGNLSSLEVFALTINGLTGIIPENLGQLANLSYFLVAGNSISGIVPAALCNLSNIRVFDIGGNKIQGTLHSNFATTMPYVEVFSISGNQISRQIPVSLSNASNLNELQLYDNRLRGNVPSLEKLDKLSTFLLATNHLGHGREGSIPFDIGRLQNLRKLSAYGNFLFGTIPHSIGNLTVLTSLALHVNNLQGSIPSSLGNCQNLLEIYLSNNNLSGAIPLEVLGIPSMSIALDLSSNYLTWLSGWLPNSLGKCASLEYLYLDGNLFGGPIPSSLSSLRGLVELDVSGNNLSGGIPEFLVTFQELKYLNLSFNDFEGVIPSEGVFKNASATFVEGNNKLCGGSPELHLSRCNSKTSSKTPLRVKIAIVVVILGVALVFSFFLIVWFRKKKKQQPTTTCVENSLLQLSYQSIRRATNGFSTQNLVGFGSFGVVYKGIHEESGAVIAIKVLNLLNRGASRSFLAECEALKNTVGARGSNKRENKSTEHEARLIRMKLKRNLAVTASICAAACHQAACTSTTKCNSSMVGQFLINTRHRNLVKVLAAVSGFDYQGNDFKALVYEFMEKGSLEDWLHPSVDMNEQETVRNLNFFQRVTVAIDVAHALEYLHHRCETPIIHCDLKPSNILLNEEMVAHISDFGLAKLLSTDRVSYSANQSSSLGFRGTIGYAPPEYGMGSELSTKGDVYSYGILLLEMFTGKRPTDERFKESLSLHNFVKSTLPEQITEIIDPTLLQQRDTRGTIANITRNRNILGNGRHLQCLVSILKIGLICSSESPSDRMDMNDVVTKLCSIRDKLHPTRLHSED
ncbi:hypothetical protein [Gossypium barbadense]|uniref:non-specific serine/threonine protein kinase n=1 Tax=Gossypium barbadense TaxID=3634 RepID=A0A5J5NDP0_GOSBA|nr:hypothetical protein [Gossypium barbadense]